jgi:hypothetical protein
MQPNNTQQPVQTAATSNVAPGIVAPTAAQAQASPATQAAQMTSPVGVPSTLNMNQPTANVIQSATGPIMSTTPAQPNTPTVSPTASMAEQNTNGTKTGEEVKPKNPNSTQSSLLISEVRDDMVVMNDGSFRAIIQCQSINFDLMSSTEQESIEVFFQGFLNSLYFPIQVFIRSQRVDMEPYLKYMEGLRSKQDNMLLANLMDDYMDFIDRLASEANIMDKSFFVVVEHSPFGDIDSQTNSTKNLFSNLFSSDKQQKISISASGFQKSKEEITNRVNAVINGLGQVGINAIRVGTRDLATIFYNIYNPDTAVNEPLTNYRKFTNLYIDKGTKEAAMEAQNG